MMAKKYCCATCFGDPELSRNIIPKVVSDETAHSKNGNCDYCGTKGTVTILPSSLSQWFEMLLDCYVQDDDGHSLAWLLKEDWALFQHPYMDEAHVKELLSDILDDGEIVRKYFVPTDLMTYETPKRWDDLRDEMMHRNRWFLDSPIDLDRLASLLEQLIARPVEFSEITKLWHRARLLSDTDHFPIEKMGAPPEKLAGHGRANPAGIRYLYLGSNARTAVSEIRPHTGERACVATFRVPPIRAIDLRNPRQSVSPFILENAEQVLSLRAGLPLLERLGEELTKPVQPSSAAFEYTPSQYLCEFIKKKGYQGVIYRSSVSDGVNLALFDPLLVDGVAVKTMQVEQVIVDVRDL